MITKRESAWYGCRRDVRDVRDRLMAFRPSTSLPATADLRQWCPPVMDQSAIGSCTAHGVTGAARFHILRRGTTYDFPMSRLQLYWDSRYIENAVEADAGAEIRDVIKVLAKNGVGHEEFWTYDITKFAEKPPQAVYDDAVQYKAQSYARVSVNATAVKAAIAGGHPVVIGISVFDSFESDEVARTGVVPMPTPGESMVGGHCLYVVGYGQKPGHFTVRNSWGADWGDRGDCYIPEAYIGSSSYGADYWVIDMFGSDAEKAAGRA